MASILTRNDKLLIAALVVIALLSAVPVVAAVSRAGTGARAIVTVSGKQAAVVALNSDKIFTLHTKSGTQTLQVAAGRIRVIDAPCPRQICRHTGWISRTGQELVCVPGEMIVRVEGGGRTRVDAVSR